MAEPCVRFRRISIAEVIDDFNLMHLEVIRHLSRAAKGYNRVSSVLSHHEGKEKNAEQCRTNEDAPPTNPRTQSASIRSISSVEMNDVPSRSGARLSSIRLT